MVNPPQFQKKGGAITESCTIPLPLENKNITQSATDYARAFSRALEEKQFVVICNVTAHFAQTITLGAWMSGHPVAYINPALTKTQLHDVLAQLGTSLKIGTPDCLALLENKNDWLSPDPGGKGDNNLFDHLQPPENGHSFVPFEWRDDECAAVLFTSGSTGMPKGVCHSLGNVIRSARLFIQSFGLESHDRLLNIAPLYSMSGLRGSVFIPLLAGCQVTEAPKVGDLEEVLNLLHSERPTVFIGGPIFFRQIAKLANKLDDELSSVRLFLCTGAKLDRPSRARIWESHRIPVIDYYGLTETTGIVIAEKIDKYNPEFTSIGTECAGVTVEFTEVNGEIDPDHAAGQMRIYSPNIFLGYLGESFQRKSYFDTGDLGMRDAEGNIFLKGRLDDRVKTSNTRWIIPQALEQFLVNRSDVADAYVRSGYDKYDRGVLYSEIVPANPSNVDDDWLEIISQDIMDELGQDYKAVSFQIVNAIHRSALGKVIKDSH